MNNQREPAISTRSNASGQAAFPVPNHSTDSAGAWPNTSEQVSGRDVSTSFRCKLCVSPYAGKATGGVLKPVRNCRRRTCLTSQRYQTTANEASLQHRNTVKFRMRYGNCVIRQAPDRLPTLSRTTQDFPVAGAALTMLCLIQ